MNDQLDCFAVFEGGGTKGIALAGALSAVEDLNIKFAGYGGASAGAIIAFLASIGLSGKEIKNVLKEKGLITLLDKRILFLLWSIKKLHILNTSLTRLVKKIIPIKSLHSILNISINKIISAVIFLNPISLILFYILYNLVKSKKGLFSTKKIEEMLCAYFHLKIPESILIEKYGVSNVKEMTFEDLKK